MLEIKGKINTAICYATVAFMFLTRLPQKHCSREYLKQVGIRILFLIPTCFCFNCVFSGQLKIKLPVLFR